VRLMSFIGDAGALVSRAIGGLSLVALVLLSGCAQTSVEKTKRALALHDEARVLYLAKDCEAALKAYRNIIKKYPAGAETWFRAGNCHARLKQRGAAVAAYREALALSPSYGKAWHNLIYVEGQALIETLGRMDQQLSDDDPARLQVAKLLEKLLRVDAAPYAASGLVSEAHNSRMPVGY